jgi:hypothetical protein
MKKVVLLFAVVCLSLLSCSDDDSVSTTEQSANVTLDATSKTTWHYYSLQKNKFVGTGEKADDAAWSARTDWDLAICRYMVRTNSGTSTIVGAQGGVFICPQSVTYDALNAMPQKSKIEADVAVTTPSHGGAMITVNMSKATVITFKKDESGNIIMPPVYLPTPVYIFRTADGLMYYKLAFTQYLNASNESGYVKFKVAKIK